MKNNKTNGAHKLLNVIGIVLCVILIPILLINLTLIFKSFTKRDEVPSIAGIAPMIVLTDSMYPEIESGDLIFVKTTDMQEVKKGDIITFFDPQSNKGSVVTHRVEEVAEENGELAFRTKGDYNNTADSEPVLAEHFIGKYKSRIAGAGKVAMFMQSTTGLIVCVIVPIILFVAYDIIRRKLYEKNQQLETDALLSELEELKKLQAEQNSEAEQNVEAEQNTEA